MTGDPFARLGLGPTATAEDVRAARKTLAKEHHPDAGGDARQMQDVNEAAGLALRLIAERSDQTESTQDAPRTEVPEPSHADDWSRSSRDVPSFTVEALPVDTFEALLVATSWIGEVLDDDPPYRLDTHLYEPVECWCRLELVPDAGASTVSLTVVGPDGRPAPPVELIRDLWVEHLNRLDWP